MVGNKLVILIIIPFYNKAALILPETEVNVEMEYIVIPYNLFMG